MHAPTKYRMYILLDNPVDEIFHSWRYVRG